MSDETTLAYLNAWVALKNAGQAVQALGQESDGQVDETRDVGGES